MPWKSVMESRYDFVKQVHESETSISQLCEETGISRTTGHKWLRRYEEGGIESLNDLSRRRVTQESTPERQVREIIEVREENPDWGGITIEAYFKKRAKKVPCARTIDRILKRNGLVRTIREIRRLRYPASKLRQATFANDIWTSDFKGWWKTKDRKRFEPLTIRDAFSRYIIKASALESNCTEAVKEAYIEAFKLYGLPIAMLTDNGVPFSQYDSFCGLTRLSVWWIKLGITPLRIPFGKPQKNGSHERMHRDLNRLKKNPAKNMREQQREVDKWVMRYNYIRPHHALGLDTPAEIYTNSDRTYRHKIPEFQYPTSFIDMKINRRGYLRWKNESLYISEALANEHIGLQPLADKNFALWICNCLLAKTQNRSFRNLTQIFKTTKLEEGVY
jgi:putative transposase